MKVKIIEGYVSKCVYNPDHDRNKNPRFSSQSELPEIEKKVNAFCTKHNVVSITPTTYTMNQHNNGGYDNVRIVFTIVYNDKTE